MKFCWTTIHVKDMDKSLAFYQEIVGLPLVRRAQASPEMELAFLGSGETQVELICDGKPQAVRSTGFETFPFLMFSIAESIIESVFFEIPNGATNSRGSRTIRPSGSSWT